MKNTKLCECIADVGEAGIVIGEKYKFNKIDSNAYLIIYDEDDTTYQNLYGTSLWFSRHFKVVKSK